MGDRVPGKAVEALMPWLAVRSPEDGRVYGALDRRGHAVRALSAALDACPVLGLTEEELNVLRQLTAPGSKPGSPPHQLYSFGHLHAKLSAALRSMSEANDA